MNAGVTSVAIGISSAARTASAIFRGDARRNERAPRN
jgi:hypothetical protein